MQKPKLNYFRLMTTPKGMLQHSIGDKPNLKYGFAVDDNARALVVADLWCMAGESSMKKYAEYYLKNIVASQAKNGKFYCYLYEDGHKKQLGTGDWFGRSVAALAFHTTRMTHQKEKADKILRKSLNLVLKIGRAHV